MKKSSSKSSHTNTELKRYLGVLHEEHMDGLKAMGEQFVDVNRKLDSHTEMIGGLAVRMSNMEMKMTVIQEDVEFIKSGLKRKVDHDEFDALIRRVSLLEKRVLK